MVRSAPQPHDAKVRSLSMNLLLIENFRDMYNSYRQREGEAFETTHKTGS